MPDEEGNSDGMKIRYLLPENSQKDGLKKCDDDLYDKLYGIVQPVKIRNGKVISKGLRKVEKIEKENILPANTICYSNRLVEIPRNQWVEQGLEKLKNCDVVFFDPDNGFPVYDDEKQKYKTQKHHKSGPKYIYHDEVVKYYKRGQSLIIYQHRDMKKKKEYLKRFWKVKDIKPNAIFYLSWHRGSARDYLFVLNSNHNNKIRPIIEEMRKSNWFKDRRPRFKLPHFTFHEL